MTPLSQSNVIYKDIVFLMPTSMLLRSSNTISMNIDSSHFTNVIDLGSVWIQLKTEKYYSKIIFKYVNNTVGLIFNEKVAEK